MYCPVAQISKHEQLNTIRGYGKVYWYIGKITSELFDSIDMVYMKKKIVEALSKKLTNEFGSGYFPVSIRRMRRFYEYYPIWSTVPTELVCKLLQENSNDKW